LLWELQGHERARIECEAWKDRDAVHVLVKQKGDPERTQTFPDCAQAVQWAIVLEETLVADGWTKRI
jgi:hypothetical protein